MVVLTRGFTVCNRYKENIYVKIDVSYKMVHITQPSFSLYGNASLVISFSYNSKGHVSKISPPSKEHLCFEEKFVLFLLSDIFHVFESLPIGECKGGGICFPNELFALVM